MTEIKTKIPAEMEPAAVGGMVADAKYIIDRVKNKNQTEVNAATDAIINQLSNEIDAVNTQDIVPVDSLPAVGSADPRKIYRVVGEDSYTDYMVNAAGDGWKELAVYTFPGIDDEPTAGSDNLVKSGGVYEAIGLVYNFNGTLLVQSEVQYIVGPVWYPIEETDYLIVQLHNISTSGDLSVHCLDTDDETQYQPTVFPIVEGATYIIVNPNGKNIKGLRLLATDVTVAGNIDIEVVAKGLQRDIEKHISNKDNPHSVTKTQVGLGNVDNTSDVNKETSYPTQYQIDLINNKLGYKVDGTILNKMVSGSGKYDIDDTKSYALNRCVFVGQGKKIKVIVGEDYYFAINGYDSYVVPTEVSRTGYQGGYEYSGTEIVSNFNYVSIYGQRIDGGDVDVNDVSIHIEYVEDAVLPITNNLSFKKGIGCLDYQPIIKNGVNLILETGQSLSVGQSSTPYTNDTVNGAYMVGTSVDFVSWEDEAIFNLIKAANNENQIITCTQSLRKLAINEDIPDEEYCGISCGIGGVPIYSLITTYKPWYQRQITRAAQAAQTANKELVCPIILFSQGESDYDDIANSVYRDASTYQDRVNLYKTRLLTLKSDIDNELLTQIGQEAPPIMFVTTPQGRYNKHERLFVHQALFEASMENYTIVLIGSAYFAPEFGGRHLSGNGYRWMGELCAKQIYETFKTKLWNAAFPINYSVNENTIDIFTGANSNLIKDTSLVLPKYACGFNIALPPYNLALIDKVETHGNVISLKVSKQLNLYGSIVGSSYFDNYTLDENGLVDNSSSTHCSTTTRIKIYGGAGSYFRVVTLAGFYYRIFYYNTDDNTVPAIDSESGWFEDGQIFLSKGNYIGIEIVSGYGGKDDITKYSLDITIEVYRVSIPIVNLKTFIEGNDCIISYAKDTAGEGNIRDTNMWCSRTSYLDDSEEISSTTGEGYISYTPDIVGEKYPIYNWLIPFDKQL